MDEILNFFSFDFSTLNDIASNPFSAMWFLFIHGGWLFFVYAMWYMGTHYWKETRQHKFHHHMEWILLAITIPRTHEQTPRAVENIFAHWAGAHSKNSWVEEWIDGRIQDTITVEIASFEGHIQYFVHTTRKFRDLIEASIYAQYPDAEIVEVEDYAKKIPTNFPNKDWELFGTEMIPAGKPDLYPLRTYPSFEDKVSGEFKDPMAVLLENMSRLQPGEQFWYQIVMTPIEQVAFRSAGEDLAKKLMGQEVKHKETLLDQALKIPQVFLEGIFQLIGLFAAPAEHKKDSNPLNSRALTMSPGERKVVEGVENKISKIAYATKIRWVFLTKKGAMTKARMVHPFIGFIKQFNTNDMLALKPESKKVGMNSTLWFFKDRRNNERKKRLLRAYIGRSNWVGTPAFFLNIEELATLWHFPISMQVKAPQLRKTEAKRAEPPINLPFG